MISFKGTRIDSAIFDMDGTMFDTERLRFQTLKAASQELFGHPLSDEILMASLGLSVQRAEALAKAHYGSDYPYADIRRRADELELAHVRNQGVPVKPGLLQVLERLRRNNLTMAVATSSRRVIAEEYLINANVLRYFDITVCGDDVNHGKPHPEIFLRAADELNRTPDRCLMIEDSENGLLAASRAGGRAILIPDLKMPGPEIREQAFQHYDSLPHFLEDLAQCTLRLGMPSVMEPFPHTFNQLKVGIHGFGAMGGGYLTQIFSHWDGYTRPCEIIAVTGNKLLRDAVNAFGKFSVRYLRQAFDQTIDNVRLIDPSDEAAVFEMYSVSTIVGLALPEPAIRQQARLIAGGLLHRFEHSDRELTVLVVLNKIKGADFVRRHVDAALAARTTPEVRARIMARTHFSETVVSRSVSMLSKEALLRQLRIKGELFEQHVSVARDAMNEPSVQPGAPDEPPKSDLERRISRLRDAAGFASALGQLHLILFNSEPDMALYAQRGGEMLERLRQVRCVDDVAGIQVVKNRLWNGTHAILAWYASLLGHSTIGKGMSDARVVALVTRLIKMETGPALLREAPECEPTVAALTETFIDSCKASFKDPCTRVGRDPLRKLQRRERILGSIALARTHGIPTPGLEFGIALALRYALRAENGRDKECLRIRQLYEEAGSVTGVLTWRGLYNGHSYASLDPVDDAALLASVSEHFERLSTPESAHWNWPATTLDGDLPLMTDGPRAAGRAHSAGQSPDTTVCVAEKLGP